MNERLTKLGMERAQHWGWTNTYTYTKSLGEQIILSATARVRVDDRAARRRRVRGALPVPGLERGLQHHRAADVPDAQGPPQRARGRATRALDIIPVDFVAAGMLLATAAVLAGEHEPVYQLGSSDVEPRHQQAAHRADRARGPPALSRTRPTRGEDDAAQSRLRARLEAMPVSATSTSSGCSAPHVQARRRPADRASSTTSCRSWGAPRLEAFAERARGRAGRRSRRSPARSSSSSSCSSRSPPTTTSRSAATTCARCGRAVTPADQDKLLWAPHLIDWRKYWLDTHFPGLQKWTFDKLDEEFGAEAAARSTRTRTLLELFEATVKLHRNRAGAAAPAARTSDAEPMTYTYGADRASWRGRARACCASSASARATASC